MHIIESGPARYNEVRPHGSLDYLGPIEFMAGNVETGDPPAEVGSQSASAPMNPGIGLQSRPEAACIHNVIGSPTVMMDATNSETLLTTERRPSIRDWNRWRWLHSSAVVHLLIVAVYCLMALWWLWPSPRTWTDQLAYDVPDGPMGPFGRADAYLIVWALSWVAHALPMPGVSLFDGNTFYPAHLTLAYSEHVIGYLPLFGPTYWLTGNPILAVNVMAFITYPLSAYCMFLFARRYVGEPAAFVGGVIFAFAPNRYFTPPHFHMLGVQYLPLILFALEEWLESAQLWSAVVLAVAMILEVLSSVYLLYTVFLLMLVAGPLLSWKFRGAIDFRRVVGLVVVVCVVCTLVGLLMAPYLVLQSYGIVPSYDDTHITLGLIPWIACIQVRRYLNAGGVGVVGYLLVVAGLAGGGIAAKPRARLLGVCLVVWGLLVSMGPRVWTSYGEIWSPYTLLLRVVPGMATVRMSARFVTIAHLGFSLLAAVGVATFVRRVSQATGWMIAMVVALTVLFSHAALPALAVHKELVGATVPAAYQWLARWGGDRAVLELPQGEDAVVGARRAYLSTFHWQPIVDGYAAYVPLHRRYLYWIARRLPREGALQELVDLVDVRWILVHRLELSAEARALWNGELPKGLVLVQEWVDDALYRVERQPVNDRRARLLSTSITIDGTAIGPIGAACPGAIVVSEWHEVPLTSGSDVRVVVLIKNNSDTPWPAFGFYPRGLVRAEASIRAENDTQVGDRILVPLNGDVRPGMDVAANVRFTAPSAGHYVLHVELEQAGVKRMADCGVGAIDAPFVVGAE